jgi:hypothetical protein
LLFQIRSLVYAWVGLGCNPIYASHIAGMTGVFHHVPLIG